MAARAETPVSLDELYEPLTRRESVATFYRAIAHHLSSDFAPLEIPDTLQKMRSWLRQSKTLKRIDALAYSQEGKVDEARQKIQLREIYKLILAVHERDTDVLPQLYMEFIEKAKGLPTLGLSDSEIEVLRTKIFSMRSKRLLPLIGDLEKILVVKE